MSVTSKEHYEMMEFFERQFKGVARMDREEKDQWPKGYVYQHGELNLLFKAFRMGVSYGAAQ